MGSILNKMHSVRWTDVQGADGAADAVPGLLGRIVWGDEESAAAALDDLQMVIFRDGLAVAEATALVVPYLWQIAMTRPDRIRPLVLELLLAIAESRAWERAAAGSGPYIANYSTKRVWEDDSHARVSEGVRLVDELLECGDEDTARIAASLITWGRRRDARGEGPTAW